MQSLYFHLKYILEPELFTKFNYNNVNEIPKIKKIGLHLSFQKNNITKNKLVISQLLSVLKSLFNCNIKNIHAKLSDTQNNITKKDLIACSLNIRGLDIYNFLEIFIYVILPKIPNFEGCNLQSIDDEKNFNFNIRQITYFPGISSLVLDRYNLQINICIAASSKIEAITLLNSLKIPFKK